MDIGEKIQKLRREKGLSQEALAEALGVSRQSVSKWESGATLPDTDKIIAMSELFGISTDFLLKGDFAPVTAPADGAAAPPQESKKKPKKAARIIALVLAICIVIAAAAVPVYYGGFRETWWALNGGKVEYPYVFVHGLGGWGEGEGINKTVQYWGGGTFDLKQYLTAQGYEVYMPSVGPISSAWDRACELYAMLTGSTVDYGAAHSAEHNHARYGRSYSAMIKDWGGKKNGGQRIKINLVGHSFGGATVRLLASLLAYGDEAEQAAGGSDTSPLFTGGKGDWVNSVITLCAPHNGSSLTEVLDSVGGVVGITDTTEMLARLCFGAADISSPVDGIYDFKLDQFGINSAAGSEKEAESAIKAVTESGRDHAAYDLSPDGAAELNKRIRTVDDIYYFSYSYCTTVDSSLINIQVPVSGTLPILYPFALAMGAYKGTTAGGIVIDESWRPNDGLVSVVSAKYPSNEPYFEYTEFPPQLKDVKRGAWQVAPTRSGDHGTVIGLNADAAQTQAFYIDLIKMIDSLKR